jgi:acetylornithine aminotransferase
MIGIELDRPCGDLLSQALDAGLLISVTADTRGAPAAAADPVGRRGRRDGGHPAPLIRRFLAS